MKILFAAISVPFPANIGQRVRNYSLVRAMHLEGHEIFILAFGDEKEATDAWLGLAGVCREIQVIKSPSHVSHIGRFGALFSRLPYGAWRMRSRGDGQGTE